MFKKFILIAFISFATFTSCSSDDGNSNSNGSSNQNTQGRITPPSWIIGTWKDESKLSGYRFTSNDLCIVTTSTTTCHKAAVDQLNQYGQDGTVVQQISDTEYKCSITLAYVTNTFHFKKLSNTTILAITEYGESFELYKQ